MAHGYTRDYFARGRPRVDVVAGEIATQLTAAARTGTALTASGSINTKGAYAQLIASTPRDIYGVWIQLKTPSSTNTNIGYLVDIATGAAASETDIIPNIITVGRSALRDGYVYYFPGIFIPAGTRISARVQCEAASQTVRVYFYGEEAVVWQRTSSAVINYGANTTNSRGVNVTPGNGTYGAWTSIGTTSQDHQLFTLLPGGSSSAGNDYVCDVGYGPNAASVTTIATAIHFVHNSNEGSLVPAFIFGDVPSGNDIFLRIAAGGTTAIFMGIMGN